MSHQGEREDAPEIEVDEDHGEVEQQGADGSGADEDGADALGEEPDEGAADERQDDDAGADEGQAGQQAQVTGQRRNSASDVIRSLKAERKQDRAELDNLRRQLEGIANGHTSRQTEEQQRLERERVALMPPEEQTAYLLQKQEQGFNARFGQLEQRLADGSDRAAFESLCARTPALAAVRDETERRLAELRRNGGNGTREVIAKYLIGERALEAASRGGRQRQQKQGQQRVQRETVKAPAARGDAQGQRRQGGSERDQRRGRLENIEI